MKAFAAILLTFATSVTLANAHPDARLVKGESVASQPADSSLIHISISGDTADKLMSAMSDDRIEYVDARETIYGVPMVTKYGENINCSRYLGKNDQMKDVTKVWCNLGKVYGPAGRLVK